MPGPLGATEAVRMVQNGSVSVTDLAKDCIARAQASSSLNALVHLDEKSVLGQATEIQKQVETGRQLPLAGVLVAVKDNISTAGLPTTCGSRILEGYVPPYDATVVARMKDAGAVILGKTNLDEFGFGTSNENSCFGPARNPWDETRTPGGSSGGSASVVAARVCPLALGSDTGGSVRSPASLCGVVGFKPTYGSVSRYGLVAFASSLDQIGPLATCVEDVALLFGVIAGYDPLDSTSLEQAPMQLDRLKEGSVRGLSIVVPKETVGEAIQPGVLSQFWASIDSLRKEGATVVERSVPSLALGVSTYYVIAPAEASSNLARFDGVRFGPRGQKSDPMESVANARGIGFGHEAKLRIMIGTYVLSAGYHDAYYLKANQIRAQMASDIDGLLAEFDLIASPTTPTVAFKLGQFSHSQMELKKMDLCTIPANLAGLPSVSLPCGLSEGLPVGLLLTSRRGADLPLLQSAWQMEQVFGPMPLPAR